jgi:putative SOS response-associated peptidase YedK
MTGDGKMPFFMRPAGGHCMAFAGLWERWHGGDEATVESCVIITTTANATLDAVHQRMPVILDDNAQISWLAQDTSTDECRALLRPAPATLLTIRKVRRAVNNPRNEGAALIEAFDDEG